MKWKGGGGTRIIGLEPQASRYHCVLVRPLELEQFYLKVFETKNRFGFSSFF